MQNYLLSLLNPATKGCKKTYTFQEKGYYSVNFLGTENLIEFHF